MTGRRGGAATITRSARRLLGLPPPVDGADGTRLHDDLNALREVVTAGDGRLDAGALERARAVLARSAERAALSGDHAVVALAGATGSGKSSLFNAIAGLDLAEVGARRPTTSTALASVWGADGAGELLEWLGIRRRHRIEHASALSGPRETELAGLVLLDMPDHDSTAASHVAEVDRLVDLVDLFVWVVDPQKYADLALYERYLGRLRAHRDVMIVVLNQVDILTPAEQNECRDDLVRVLRERGLAGVPVLSTSARTGQGVEELRVVLRDRLAGKRASTDRLDADVQASLAELSEGGVGRRTPELSRRTGRRAVRGSVRGRRRSGCRGRRRPVVPRRVSCRHRLAGDAMAPPTSPRPPAAPAPADVPSSANPGDLVHGQLDRGTGRRPGCPL